MPSTTTAPLTAWVIEDEAKWQDAFKLILGMAFDDVQSFTASRQAETQPWFIMDNQGAGFVWPDIVLMDWQLANDENGLALADRWVELGLPAERIIVVSGSADIPEHHYASVNKVEAATKLLPSLMALKQTA